MPHRGDQGADADAVTGRAGVRLAEAEALVDGLDDLVEGEAGLQVLLRGVADLGVHDAVGGQVLGAVRGDLDQGLAGLHHGAGVREGLQVADQRAGVGGLAEPLAEFLRVRGGEALVADRGGQLDDGLGPQPAVEVVVQEHLRGAGDLLGGGDPGAGARGGDRDLVLHCGSVAPTRVDSHTHATGSANVHREFLRRAERTAPAPVARPQSCCNSRPRRASTKSRNAATGGVGGRPAAQARPIARRVRGAVTSSSTTPGRGTSAGGSSATPSPAATRPRRVSASSPRRRSAARSRPPRRIRR